MYLADGDFNVMENRSTIDWMSEPLRRGSRTHNDNAENLVRAVALTQRRKELLQMEGNMICQDAQPRYAEALEVAYNQAEAVIRVQAERHP